VAVKQFTEYPHGTLSRYTKGKCRCDECRRANTDYHREWRNANRSKARQASRKWIAGHRSEALERTRARNPGASARQAAKWRSENREAARAKSLAWNRAHPEVMKAVARRWQAANPRRVRIANRDKRVVTERDWQRLCARYDYRCAYCRRIAKLTQDHVIPIARGGRHSIGNLLPACQSCNSRKHSKLLVEWRRDRLV
jgi:5-methylcytosine-specific restriction endonuclease McrA